MSSLNAYSNISSTNGTTAKRIVETFLTTKLADLPKQLDQFCAADMQFSSPLGHSRDVKGFADFLNETRWQFSELTLQKVFADGQDVCAVYVKRSHNPQIGELIFTDVFKLSDNKIKSITSNFNAKPLIDTLCEI